MIAPEPTRPADEHTDAVAEAMHASAAPTLQGLARAILTSTDPAVHLAMLAALVRAGVLTPEDAPIYRGAEHHHWQQRWDGEHTHEGRRFVTPWEVAP